MCILFETDEVITVWLALPKLLLHNIQKINLSSSLHIPQIFCPVFCIAFWFS